MDTSSQNQPQIQQTIVVVGKQKSVGVAFLLAFLFGPLGLLYASVTGGIVMFLLGIVIGIFTLGLGLILIWIGSIIWAVIAAGNANKKMTTGTGLHINTNFSGQQPTQPNQSIQQASQPIEQRQLNPVIEKKQEQIIEPAKMDTTTPISAQPSFDLGQWFDKNKKSVIVAGGGVLALLLLVVAVRFVFSVDFNNSKKDTPSENTYVASQTVSTNETSSATAEITNFTNINDFFAAYKRAVGEKDINKVAEFVEFPFDQQMNMMTKSEFITNYQLSNDEIRIINETSAPKKYDSDLGYGINNEAFAITFKKNKDGYWKWVSIYYGE